MNGVPPAARRSIPCRTSLLAAGLRTARAVGRGTREHNTLQVERARRGAPGSVESETRRARRARGRGGAPQLTLAMRPATANSQPQVTYLVRKGHTIRNIACVRRDRHNCLATVQHGVIVATVPCSLQLLGNCTARCNCGYSTVLIRACIEQSARTSITIWPKKLQSRCTPIARCMH